MITLDQARQCALEHLLPELSGSDYADTIADTIAEDVMMGHWGSVWRTLHREGICATEDDPEMWRVAMVVDMAISKERLMSGAIADSAV